MKKKKVTKKKTTKSTKKKKTIKKIKKTQAQKDRENALYDVTHGYYDDYDEEPYEDQGFDYY